MFVCSAGPFVSLREKKRKKDMKSASCMDCDEVTIGPSISLIFFSMWASLHPTRRSMHEWGVFNLRVTPPSRLIVRHVWALTLLRDLVKWQKSLQLLYCGNLPWQPLVTCLWWIYFNLVVVSSALYKKVWTMLMREFKHIIGHYQSLQ